MSENSLIQQEQSVAMTMPVNNAVNVWSDKAAFDQLTRVAAMLSKSTVVPLAYQGKPEDCFIAAELASRMNTSPLFIMQNLYVVKGKPSWAGQACMAMIISCGKFRNVKHVYTGTRGTDKRGCYVEATRISDGEVLHGTEVTLQMAKDEGWLSNSKWRTMPEQMLGYRAASFFARMFCPEAMMGLQTTEEIYDAAPAHGSQNAQDLSHAILNEETQNQSENKSENTMSTDIEPLYICENCGKEIVKSGRYSVESIVKTSKEKYGRPLCMECGKKAKQEADRKAAEEAAKQAEQATAAEQEDDLAAQLMEAAQE